MMDGWPGPGRVGLVAWVRVCGAVAPGKPASPESSLRICPRRWTQVARPIETRPFLGGDRWRRKGRNAGANGPYIYRCQNEAENAPPKQPPERPESLMAANRIPQARVAAECVSIRLNSPSASAFRPRTGPLPLISRLRMGRPVGSFVLFRQQPSYARLFNASALAFSVVRISCLCKCLPRSTAARRKAS
jgi:hypothetical protein